MGEGWDEKINFRWKGFRWKGLDIEHFSLRALALFLAIVLWFVATERPQRNLGLDVRQVSVALRVEHVGDGLEVASVPASVDVAVEGPRLILPFQIQDVFAAVDVSGLGPGVHSVPVDVRLPTGTTLKSVQPREVRVVLDERVRRRHTVVVSVDGVPPGVAVHVVSLAPHEVDVFGSATSVARVHALMARVPYQDGRLHAQVLAYDVDGRIVEDVILSPVVVEVVLDASDVTDDSREDGEEYGPAPGEGFSEDEGVGGHTLPETEG